MRLTKKYDGNYHQYDGTYVRPQGEDSKDWKDKCVNKLGQLEDIEEEFDIELIVLFKAIKNGFYYKSIPSIRFAEPYSLVIDLESSRLIEPYEDASRIFYFSDYGSTWALTNEELK